MKDEARSGSQSLASDSLADWSQRSSKVSRSTDSIGSQASAEARFQQVSWLEAPSDEPTTSEPPDSSDRAPGEPATARSRFGEVPWHPDEVESREPSEGGAWSDDMKVKNFFDGMS